MNHKNKILAIVTLLFLTSGASYAFDTSSMTNGMMTTGGNFMQTSWISDVDTMDTTDSEDTLWEDSSTSEDVLGDQNYSEDAEIATNTEIKWNVVAEKNLKIATNVVIDGNLTVNGDLILAPNVEITGYVKVKGNLKMGTNSKVEGTIYGYKNIDAGVNVETKGKLKSAGVLNAGVNYEWQGKLYAFGGKKMWVNAAFKDAKEKGILGRIDAYLKIDISSEDFAKVKEFSAQYDEDSLKIVGELKKLKVSLSVANSKLKLAKDEDKAALETQIASINSNMDAQKDAGRKLVMELMSNVQPYIEDEEFDNKGITVYVSNDELARFELKEPAAKQVISNVKDTLKQTDDSGTKASQNLKNGNDEKLKATMKSLLEKKLAKFDKEKKDQMYVVLVGKLDTMLEKVEAPKMKKTLTLLKEVVLELQDDSGVEGDIDNLLNDTSSSSTSSQTQATTDTQTSTQQQ